MRKLVIGVLLFLQRNGGLPAAAEMYRKKIARRFARGDLQSAVILLKNVIPLCAAG